MIKQLTKAEEQIMQVLWKLDKAFLREIIDALPEPKPHNNTVATRRKGIRAHASVLPACKQRNI